MLRYIHRYKKIDIMKLVSESYQEFVNEARKKHVFDNSKIYAIHIGRHVKGHRVMSVHGFDRQSDLSGYLETRPDSPGDMKFGPILSVDLDLKINDLMKTYKIKNRHVFIQ